ncbi:MAG: flavodoxin-dependent (E)-4-hydroxy-3-methylbut-2-enyl-diphosphate synthase [Clostridiales Family XIII bacterium]|jgi:(E)-4-hydroxy-3-methylbut-2-enyl-diphosphate synthase|nr:flavodoxin-dependent (E)-4-hydroxy-3-methylbut-2-enyl-diphosphate synthase [Clostridiales Family XIII bacterium]
MNGRRKTRQVSCGGVAIGGGAPIPIQSMTNTFTEDADATLAQIRRLADAGCDIVRCAVPTREAARSLHAQTAASPLPVIADLHFDHRLALAAIEAGCAKVRINPGNIGGAGRVREVADAAGRAGIPIRIGVNSGSVEKDLLALHGGPTAEALCASAERGLALLSGMGFSDVVVSIKSSDVRTGIAAHRLLAGRTDAPLHIGVTEAGIGEDALLKSAAGIGALLADGIGDTVRVSLTGDPVAEVPAARGILRAVGLLPGAIEVVSCPTCGRTKADLARIAGEVAKAVGALEAERIRRAKGARAAGGGPAAAPLAVAVMGCAVNGPGEAAHADVGVAFGDGRAVLFRKGEKILTIPESEAVSACVGAVQELLLREAPR